MISKEFVYTGKCIQILCDQSSLDLSQEDKYQVVKVSPGGSHLGANWERAGERGAR